MTMFRIAAALCFLAVALGAFGAHSLRSTLETHGMLDVWNKAVFYHFVHAIALFALALYGRSIAALGGCFSPGSSFSAGACISWR
jgi:uncharacterized membrane protein YgdD (TMEM256/DUF423 family)